MPDLHLLPLPLTLEPEASAPAAGEVATDAGKAILDAGVPETERIAADVMSRVREDTGQRALSESARGTETGRARNALPEHGPTRLHHDARSHGDDQDHDAAHTRAARPSVAGASATGDAIGRIDGAVTREPATATATTTVAAMATTTAAGTEPTVATTTASPTSESTVDGSRHAEGTSMRTAFASAEAMERGDEIAPARDRDVARDQNTRQRASVAEDPTKAETKVAPEAKVSTESKLATQKSSFVSAAASTDGEPKAGEMLIRETAKLRASGARRDDAVEGVKKTRAGSASPESKLIHAKTTQPAAGIALIDTAPVTGSTISSGTNTHAATAQVLAPAADAVAAPETGRAFEQAIAPTAESRAFRANADNIVVPSVDDVGLRTEVREASTRVPAAAVEPVPVPARALAMARATAPSDLRETIMLTALADNSANRMPAPDGAQSPVPARAPAGAVSLADRSVTGEAMLEERVTRERFFTESGANSETMRTRTALRIVREPLHYYKTAAVLEAPVEPLAGTATSASNAAHARPIQNSSVTAVLEAGALSAEGESAGGFTGGESERERAFSQAMKSEPIAAISGAERARAVHALSEAESLLDVIPHGMAAASTGAGSPVNEAGLRTQTLRSPLPEAIDQITRMVVNDQKNVTIQLTPIHLGTIQGKIAVQNGRVVVKLDVDTESVQGVLQSSVDLLQESLQREGMDLQALAVTVSGQEGNGKSWQGHARESRALPAREKTRKNSEKAEDTGKNSERSLNLLI